jgi:hypothetical protein
MIARRAVVVPCFEFAVHLPSFCLRNEESVHVRSTSGKTGELLDSERAQAQPQNAFVVKEFVAGGAGRCS